MNSIIFARVSSREQEDTGYSLPAQEKLLKSYAEKQGFIASKIFSISESASGKKQREIFTGMMAFVKNQNIKILICEKVDRLTRNFKDAVMIDEWLEEDEERQVHLVKDSLVLHKNSRSQEKLNWGIRILFAKNYTDNLGEEVRKGQKEKIAQGWLPTKPPFGFKTIGEKGRKIHVVDREKAPFIRKMFELYSTGHYSLKTLTEKLYLDGFRSHGGNKVVKSRIHKLISDPFYIGRNVWNGEVYDGKQEKLIDEYTFNNAQRLLKSKTTPKYSKHEYLFKGLIRCYECTGLITWEAQKGTTYGHCNHYRNCSQKIWAKEWDVENQILSGFESLIIKDINVMDWLLKALKQSHQDEIFYNSSAIDELTKTHEQAKNRLDRLYDDKLDGKISEEYYDRKFKQYSQEKEKVVQAMKDHSKAGTKYISSAHEIFELSQKSKDLYLRGRIDQKRKLITSVFTNLMLNEGILKFDYTKAFELLIKAVEATNRSKTVFTSKIDGEIFEPSKKPITSAQNYSFSLLRPELLRG